MPPLFVSAVYAVLFSLMLIALAFRVIKLRKKHRIMLLDGNIDELKQAIRAHGNFVEYVPFCLILMALSEINGAPLWALHLMGAILLLSRLIHDNGITTNSLKRRVIGMSGTFASLFGGSIVLLSTLFSL